MSNNAATHCEPTKRETCEKGLAFLRDEARNAHYRGEGLLVNHICMVALARLGEWRASKLLEPSLRETFWALVFPLYWLRYDFTLTELQRHLGEIRPLNELDTGILTILRGVHYLVEQPLDSASETCGKMRGVSLEWVAPDLECEAKALLGIAIELVWHSDPTADSWRKLSNRWSKNSRYLRPFFEEMTERLQAQGALIDPGAGNIERMSVRKRQDTEALDFKSKQRQRYSEEYSNNNQ
jgi:hypothetical protein